MLHSCLLFNIFLSFHLSRFSFYRNIWPHWGSYQSEEVTFKHAKLMTAPPVWHVCEWFFLIDKGLGVVENLSIYVMTFQRLFTIHPGVSLLFISKNYPLFILIFVLLHQYFIVNPKLNQYVNTHLMEFSNWLVLLK